MTLGKRAKIGHELLRALFSQPITSAKLVEETLDITPPSANSLIKQFESLGIFREITGFKRNRLFAFSEYLKIFKK
jgi:Fic family protein